MPMQSGRPDGRGFGRAIAAAALLLVGGLQSVVLARNPATAEDPEHLYARDVRPLLAEKCASCHGALRQSAGLRLDHGRGMLEGGESGPSVDVARPSESLVVQRVLAKNAAERMPPEGEGEPLTEQQTAALQRWIAAGARFPADEEIPPAPGEWWSVRPVASPTVPPSSDPWIRNPIDAFIAESREKQGLPPAAEAAPALLLRRLYLDLIGLPPTRAELSAWLADPDPDKYDRTVDELLARPEYGQRWGRHWMDVWRYSDWYGSRGINEIRSSQRHIWRWRDWIVDALNADKPYDRMILEMLAGDELAPDDPAILCATGFLGRNWYKFDRDVWLFDAVEQTSQAFLGLTLRCARCHDHKYDPVSQLEYYRFRAFFEPHDVRTDPLGANLATEKDATLGQVLREGVSRVYDRELDAATWVFRRGDPRAADKSAAVTPAVPAFLGGDVEIEPVELPVTAWYPHLRPAVAAGLLQSADGKIASADAAVEKAKTRLGQADAAVVERERARGVAAGAEAPREETPAALLHDRFQERAGLWKVVSGDWAWQDGVLRLPTVASFATVVAEPVLPRNCRIIVRYRTLQPGTLRSVGFSFDYVDQGNSQDVYTSTGDGSQSIQAFHRLNGQQHYPAAGIVKTPLRVGETITVEAIVREQHLTLLLDGIEKLRYVMPAPRREGRFALWVHQGSAEFQEVEIRPLLPTLDDLRSEARQAAAAVRAAEAAVASARAERESLACRLEAERARHGDVAETERRRLAAVALRADKTAQLAKAAEELAAATDEAKAKELREKITGLERQRDSGEGEYAPLGPAHPRTSTGRRLALARWIASPLNPRTARVAVNQIWLRHFGEALVPTVANFGMNGDKPSHPALLDWLAAELIRGGWRMKPLHRLIVRSAAWRQAAVNPRTEQRDPGNRWLSRMNSRRMEAEVVRDSLLHAAGLLDRQTGGPEIPEAELQTVFRRSMYFRSTPNEKAVMLETFDGPNPNECYRRQVSVMPQQALALMNSGLAVDAARVLAESLAADCATDDPAAREAEFVRLSFETVLSRPPTDAESAVCLRFLADLRRDLTAAVDAFPAGPQTSRRPPAADVGQRARESLVSVLFSHNDFVTIR